MTSLTKSMQMAAEDLRRVRPTKADQKRNPDTDVMQVWRDDIDHTIRCKEITGSAADEFRAACLL